MIGKLLSIPFILFIIFVAIIVVYAFSVAKTTTSAVLSQKSLTTSRPTSRPTNGVNMSLSL